MNFENRPKRKKPVLLTVRSRKYLEHHGYIVALVERSLDVPKFPGSAERFRNKFDAFGIADLACIHPSFIGTLWVQTTDHKHGQEHIEKMLAAKAVPTILRARNRLQVHTWKAYRRNGRKLWNLKLYEIQYDAGELVAKLSEFWFYDNMQQVEVF